jgi:ketosteroid isomerase-like protein
MKMVSFVMLLCVIAAPLEAGHPEPMDHPDYEIVKQVIEDSIGWAMTKDLDRLLQIFADDDDLLIWWIGSNGGADGIDDLKETAEKVWMTPDFEATSFEFRDVRIRFSSDGTIAWYSCHLDDCGIWKGKEHCVENVRKTGVLEKRGDQWTIVQSHASWPVDKIPDDVWRRLAEARQDRDGGN